MTRIAVALGSNQGDRNLMLKQAAQHLSEDLLQGAIFSSVYESDAWGAPAGKGAKEPKYLNAVAVGETDWKPPAIVNFLKNVERELGRVYSAERNTSRLIDLDLLLYGAETWNTDGVIVPHPRMQERAFVLMPLVEVASDWVLAGDARTMAVLLKALPESALKSTIRIKTELR